MFHSARLKLTAWYLLIIMSISILFSVIIYNGVNTELRRFEQMQQYLQERQQEDWPLSPSLRRLQYNLDMVAEARRRVILTLGVLNIGILVLSGMAGYFLAGRTLEPIQEMVEEQKRFVTDVSHELRTPLTALKSEIEVNLRDKKMSLTEAKKLLKSNLEEVNNLQILSDNLIKLTMYSQTKTLQFSSVTLREVFEDAVKKIMPLAKRKSITIKNMSGEERVKGERQSLTELFVILLDNAIKYSHVKTKVTVSSAKKRDMVTISVKDEGMGISHEDIDHLFDRFYRADKSRTKTDIQGYGLGLSIAKKIVDEHHGRIVVKSEVDRGSEFIVSLPATTS